MSQSEPDNATINALVAKHVMGLDPECSGLLRQVDHVMNDQDPRMKRYYCRECLAEITVSRGYFGLPESHRRNTPNYCEDLNAAMQIVEHLNQQSEDNIEKAVFRNIAYDVNWWRLSKQEFCRVICINALKACGVPIKP